MSAGKSLPLLCLLALSVCAQTQPPPPQTAYKELEEKVQELAKKNGPGTDQMLRLRLLDMLKTDQDIRKKILDTPEEQRSEMFDDLRLIDSRLTRDLKDLVDEKGWPTMTLVGAEGSDAAATILIHSPDADFQRSILPRLAELVEQEKIVGTDIAHLTDKMLVAEGKNQRYGTQFILQEGRAVLHPVDEVETLDQRRARYLLPTMEQYKKSLAEFYKVSVE